MAVVILLARVGKMMKVFQNPGYSVYYFGPWLWLPVQGVVIRCFCFVLMMIVADHSCRFEQALWVL